MLTEIDPGIAFLVAGFLALVAVGLSWRARRFLARLVRGSGRITHFISVAVFFGLLPRLL
jgi:hypothetical protein